MLRSTDFPTSEVRLNFLYLISSLYISIDDYRLSSPIVNYAFDFSFNSKLFFRNAKVLSLLFYELFLSKVYLVRQTVVLKPDDDFGLFITNGIEFSLFITPLF